MLGFDDISLAIICGLPLEREDIVPLSRTGDKKRSASAKGVVCIGVQNYTYMLSRIFALLQDI